MIIEFLNFENDELKTVLTQFLYVLKDAETNIEEAEKTK